MALMPSGLRSWVHLSIRSYQSISILEPSTGSGSIREVLKQESSDRRKITRSPQNRI